VDDTPNLGLPYIMAAQSQKHVTHNEAIRALDAMVQLAVLDRNLSAPPVAPAEGARYIVGGSPTGAWSGHAGKIAAFQDGAWMLYAPVEGWIAWIADEDVAVVWDGSTWSALTTGGGGGGGSDPDPEFDTVAINGATADATNRLSLNAPATLLNHDGDDHQLKINKASASDNASLLYQDAFSGRAELGLAGDDDFHFKVSPDGTSWKEAIVIDRSTGVVAFPFTSLAGGRELLTGDRTYYVRTDGSDSNTGLVNSSGGAFLTVQAAENAARRIDFNGYTVTISLGDGTYTAGATVGQKVGQAGASSYRFTSTSGSAANVIIDSTVGDAFACNAACTIDTLEMTPAGYCIRANMCLVVFGGVRFGAAGGHITAGTGAKIQAVANYAITGGAAYHWVSTAGGYIEVAGYTITLGGTPAFTNAFCYLALGGMAQVAFNTYSGSATGVRHVVESGGILSIVGSTLPGNSAGTGGTTAGGGFVI
jgi:hypothetical protein